MAQSVIAAEKAGIESGLKALQARLVALEAKFNNVHEHLDSVHTQLEAKISEVQTALWQSPEDPPLPSTPCPGTTQATTGAKLNFLFPSTESFCSEAALSRERDNQCQNLLESLGSGDATSNIISKEIVGACAICPEEPGKDACDHADDRPIAFDSPWVSFTLGIVAQKQIEGLSAVLGEVELRACWAASNKRKTRGHTQILKQQSSVGVSSPSDSPIKDDLLDCSAEPGSDRCVLHPTAKKRLLWDLFGMLLIAYDTVWLPLNFSFDPSSSEVSEFPDYMFYVTIAFWSADIVISFFKGYYDDGDLVMQYAKIARNYVVTWFVPDCIIVAFDWMTLLADSGRSGSSLVRLAKALRSLRVLRSLRLLRLAKMRKLLEDIQDRISAEWVHIGLRIAKLTIVLLVCNHMIACTWWAIGKSPPGNQTSWIEFFGYEHVPLRMKYFTSLHWTLTQFTPASMEIHPQNSTERAFAVTVLLFALICFSSYISSITAAMTQLRNLNQKSQQQFSMLRRFLKDHAIPTKLGTKIKRYLAHRVESLKGRTQERDVEILALLSEPLKKELQEQLHKPLLLRHPFFHYYCGLEPHAMRHLCHQALSVISLSEGDMLFTAGVNCEKMVFVLEGLLQYQWQASDSEPEARVPKSQPQKLPSPHDLIAQYLKRQQTGSTRSEHLRRGSWCSEHCLWTHWVHIGTMQVLAMSSLLAVDAEKFVSVTMKNTVVMTTTSLYAQWFVKDLNMSMDALSDLSRSQEELHQVCMDVFAVEGGSQSFQVDAAEPSLTCRKQIANTMASCVLL